MFVRINGKKYTATKNLSFAPEVDMTGQSLPINELYVEVHTYDNIRAGRWIYLYNDLDQLWAKYWIILAEHITDEFVMIQAQSAIGKLERKMVKAHMYENEPIDDVLSSIFGSIQYTLHSSFQNATVTGYCPKQTRKERLQWVCLSIGAWVRTFFSDKIMLLPIDHTKNTIPMRKTYWRPTIKYQDYITKINITFFAFTEIPSGTPEPEGEIIEVDAKKYIVTRTETSLELSDDEIPHDVPTSEIDFSDMYLVNSSNVSAILNRLALLYFKREELDADIINNGEYQPAYLVGVPLSPPDEDEGAEAIGFIDSCDFSFGLQSKSRIHMHIQELRSTTKLIINYLYNDVRLGRDIYQFGVGYEYSIENPYVDQISGLHRYVYYPLQKRATGTIVEGTNTNNQQYDIALHHDTENNVLEILSVTGVAWKDVENGVISIE